MLLAIDFSRSMNYFPQVIHIKFSTYQQVCDVKLALIGFKICDRSGHIGCNANRMKSLFVDFRLHFTITKTVNGNSYLSAT
jgi:hypothetical protein